MTEKQKAAPEKISKRVRLSQEDIKKLKGQTNWASLIAEERKERERK